MAPQNKINPQLLPVGKYLIIALIYGVYTLITLCTNSYLVVIGKEKYSQMQWHNLLIDIKVYDILFLTIYILTTIVVVSRMFRKTMDLRFHIPFHLASGISIGVYMYFVSLLIRSSLTDHQFPYLVQNEALIQHIEYYFFLYASLMAVFYMITYYEHHARSEIKQLEISRQLLQHQLDTFIQGVDGDILIRKMDDILKLLDSDNLSASNEMLNMSEYLREILILSRKGKHGIDEEIRFVKRFLHFIGISQNLSVSILFDRSKSQDNLEIKPLTIKLVLDAIFHYFKKFIPPWEKVGLSIQKESEKVTIQIQPEITQISDESESRKSLEDFFNHLKNFDSIGKTDIHLDYKTEAIIIDIPSV